MNIIKFNNSILKYDGKWLETDGTPTPPPTYETVTINGLIWMKYNLAYDDGGSGIYTYDNGTVNGVNIGLQYSYTHDAAVRVANKLNQLDGWRLPTNDDWVNLINYAGGPDLARTKLKATEGWNQNGNGTDDYGFRVIPVSRYDIKDPAHPVPMLEDLGNYAWFWSSTEWEINPKGYIYVYFNYNNYNPWESDWLGIKDHTRDIIGVSPMSLRLVKNVPVV